MSESSNLPVTAEERKIGEARAQRQVEAQRQATEPKELDDLHTEHGDTTIADNVVQKLTGIAAREIPGVFAMGNAARRALGNITQRIPGGQTNVTGGVAVQKGERETAIDVSVVVEYGAPIVEVSQAIRDNIIRAVEHGTGLRVVSVDVNVTDVHLPEEDQNQNLQTSNDDLR